MVTKESTESKAVVSEQEAAAGNSSVVLAQLAAQPCFLKQQKFVVTKETEIVKIKNTPYNSNEVGMILKNSEGVKRQIYFENPIIIDSNAILDELESFANSINKNKKPIVDLKDGYLALDTAQKIIDIY